MTVQIQTSEWSPAYFLSVTTDGEKVEVDEATAARWKRAIAEFSNVQIEMETALIVAQYSSAQEETDLQSRLLRFRAMVEEERRKNGKECGGMTNRTPKEGDKYEHETGVYVVDWVCDDGDGDVIVGLRGEAWTYTGRLSTLERDDGFRRVKDDTMSV
jgi:hypothetical protein